VRYGYSTSPCSGPSDYSPGYLQGISITLSTQITVTALGVLEMSTATPTSAQLALYTDNAGAPYALVTNTGAATIGPGPNEIPVVSQVTAGPGTYWVAIVNQNYAQPCTDLGANTPIDHVSLQFGSALPDPFGTATPNTFYIPAFYVVGH
jgi:hypothetical protein